MPKILVRIADEELANDIAAALTESNKRNNVVVGPPVSPDQNPHALAKELVESKTAAVVLDYLAEDAASVKLLQSSTDAARIPHFIFIMPEEYNVSHVLMAVNEGASAIIERPVRMPALVNYVERAISGPGRFRSDLLRGDATSEDVGELEDQVRQSRQFIVALQKLTSYLLSTPMSEQRRQVLVVSDSAYQRDLLKKVLEYHMFGVLTASNAADGLRIALEEKPLIVISDLELEGQNGLEFCHTLKIENKFIPCHFVICTANREKIDKILAPGNGVDDCVIKSGDSDYRELISRVALGLLLEDVKKSSSLTRIISARD